MPTATAVAATLDDILPLRALFLRELHAQCRYDAVHRRGWADHWQLRLDDTVVGYAAVKGYGAVTDRDAIFEWYVVPPARASSDAMWRALIAAARPAHVECQTNDPCLHPMALCHAATLAPSTWLFEAGPWQEVDGPGVVRARRDDDVVFPHTVEPIGDIVLVVGGTIVATSGYYTHYNPPFADLFMEVSPDHRRRGYGTRVVAEAIRACWLAGHVPAARCSLDNAASRATLLKAGMHIVGQVVVG